MPFHWAGDGLANAVTNDADRPDLGDAGVQGVRGLGRPRRPDAWMEQVAHEPTKQVVVVGAGMVGHRFVDELVARDRDQPVRRHLVGAEEYEPYNRILLSEVLAGRADVAALTPAAARTSGSRCSAGVARRRRSTAASGSVELDDGTALRYDHLVLATGARAFVPPIDGLGERASRRAHVHVLRTIDDCRDIVAARRQRPARRRPRRRSARARGRLRAGPPRRSRSPSSTPTGT